MLILYAILIASVGISHLADASAIKGLAHARPHEEARSIKLGAVNNLDKQVKQVASGQQQPTVPLIAAPSVPILESTKKIYNDETIRRIAYAQQADQQQPVGVVKQQAVVGSPVVEPVPVVVPVVAHKEQVPLVAEQVVPVVPVVQSAPQSVVVPVQPVVKPVEPVVPVAVPVAAAPQVEPVSVVKEQAVEPKIAPVAEPKEVKVAESKYEPAVVAPKSAPVVPEQSVPVVKAASDELPQQSDRSAPTRSVQPVVLPVVQPIVQPIVPPQQTPLASLPVPAVPQPIQPVVPSVQVVPQVVGQSQPEPQQSLVKESPLAGKKDEVAPVQAVPVAEPIIEVPAPDPGLVLSEPIDSTTKLLIDLDEHVQKFLPAEDQQQPAQPKDQQLVAGVDYSPANGSPVAVAAASPADPTGKSSGPLVPYSSSSADDTIVPPLPPLDGVEKASSASGGAIVSGAASSTSGSSGSSASAAAAPSATRQGGHQHQNQQQVITQLLDQLDSLQNRIQDTINQLVARRRYVMSALLRPMGTYVRRVRTNLERLQNRVNQLQAAATSVGGQNRPGGGFVDAAAIETIRRRIDDISKRISDIVNRIRFGLTPTSAPLNSNGRK